MPTKMIASRKKRSSVATRAQSSRADKRNNGKALSEGKK